jgi:hypothetical protein
MFVAASFGELERLPGGAERLPDEVGPLPSNLRAVPDILVAVLGDVQWCRSPVNAGTCR